VVSGDSLLRLAARYGTSAEAIAGRNGLRASDSIYIGQRLLIPPAASASDEDASNAGDAPATLSGRSLVTHGLDLWSCSDFESWEQAQSVYEANLPGDPNLLDGDRNGVACERLLEG
jgi:LysM repeat protein